MSTKSILKSNQDLIADINNIKSRNNDNGDMKWTRINPHPSFHVPNAEGKMMQSV